MNTILNALSVLGLIVFGVGAAFMVARVLLNFIGRLLPSSPAAHAMAKTTGMIAAIALMALPAATAFADTYKDPQSEELFWFVFVCTVLVFGGVVAIKNFTAIKNFIKK